MRVNIFQTYDILLSPSIYCGVLDAASLTLLPDEQVWFGIVISAFYNIHTNPYTPATDLTLAHLIQYMYIFS